jgi:DNA topoisomerase-6 subunit B
MYGQLTTGKPVVITSKTGKGRPAHHYKLQIDTRKNQPMIIEDTLVEWDQVSGTRVSIELEATYKKGKRSVDDYISQTAVANPHARISYTPPRGEPLVYERVSHELPDEPKAMKPHPYGVELGVLIRMLHDSKERTLLGALTKEFSRVSPKVAHELIEKSGLRPKTSPRKLNASHIERLFKTIPTVKLRAPSANCLSPIGQLRLMEALKQWVPANFYGTVTRPPQVYRGMPFQVEVGLAWGGQLPGDELVELKRFANRVPLLYQQASCAVTKAAISTEWRNYGLSQSRGALPTGPAIVLVHIASAWVPFTSESKEAIAHYPEILKEIRLGLMEVGRKLGSYVRARKRAEIENRKRSYIEKYIPHIGIGLQQILGHSDARREQTVEILTETLRRTRSKP